MAAAVKAAAIATTASSTGGATSIVSRPVNRSDHINRFRTSLFSQKPVSIGLAFRVFYGGVLGLKYTQLFDLIPEIFRYTSPTLYPADAP
jgi:hypothetical protein